jgi:hypothetical protein
MVWYRELQTDARTKDFVILADEFEKVCRYTLEEANREDEVVFRIGDLLVHVNTVGSYIYMLVDSEKGFIFAITFTTAQCGDKEIPVAIFDDIEEEKRLVAILGHNVEEVLGPSSAPS